MNNKRWDSAEKIQLMKLYSQGRTYEDIASLLNRSPNAVKLRVESIVYDNLSKGKDMGLLVKTLNKSPDMIKQLYYSHKSFKESRGEEVSNIEFGKYDSMIGGKTQPKVLHGGMDRRIERIEKENKVLRGIIENYKMKRQIRKLYANGKLDNKSVEMYEMINKKS